MHTITPAQVKQWLAPRPLAAHKGNFGRVLVVAGSRSMCGAGYLCAKSALMSGAGLVFWALPASMQPSFAASLPEAITLALPEDENGEIEASAWELFPDLCKRYKPSLVVAGPGMGSSALLPSLLAGCALPLLVDADGLNALSGQTAWHTKWPKERPAIFTPHAQEMARLLGEPIATDEEARLYQVEKLVELTGAVAVFKGAGSLVSAPSQDGIVTLQNTTGTVALAKGGSGDVLSGLIAGLWAQLGTRAGFSVRTAYQATACAVYIHGLAGELAAQSKSTYSVLASDTLACIAQAYLHVLACPDQ